MANQLIKDYTAQGLNRLGKEKLVTIISTLQDMQTDVAMKLSENIPAFFATCDDALRSTDAIYREAMDKNDQYNQIIIDNLGTDRKYCEGRLANTETEEEREKIKQEIYDIDERISATKKQALAERNALIKDRGKFYLKVLCLMGATVGVSVKVGKKFM